MKRRHLQKNAGAFFVGKYAEGGEVGRLEITIEKKRFWYFGLEVYGMDGKEFLWP